MKRGFVFAGFVILILSFFLANISSTDYGENLLINSDMESTSGWSCNADTCGYNFDNFHHDHKFYNLIRTGGDLEGIYQNVSVTEGKSYMFSIWIRELGNTSMGLYINNKFVKTLQTTPNTWRQQEVYWESDVTGKVQLLIGGEVGINVYIDDVSFSEELDDEVPDSIPEENETIPDDSEKSCEDSDGGKNYYERGKVAYEFGNKEEIFRDYCEGSKAYDYYCDKDNVYSLDFIDCPNGCEDGACVEEKFCESVYLNSDGTKLYLNDSINEVKRVFTKSDFPEILKDGEFSGNRAVLYTQIINIGSDKIKYGKAPTSSDSEEYYIDVSTTQSNYLYNEIVRFNKTIDMTSENSKGKKIRLFGKNFVIGDKTNNERLVLLSGSEQFILEDGSAVLEGEEKNVIDGTLVDFQGELNSLVGLTISIYGSESDKDAIRLGETFTDPFFGTLKVFFESYDGVQGAKIKLGGCVKEETLERKSCSELKEFIKNPYDIKIGDSEWILNWNGSYENDEEKDYYASFSRSSDYDSGYVSVDITEINSSEGVAKKLEQATEEGICQKEKIYSDDNFKVIYLCKDLWTIGHNYQENLDDDLNYNQITAIWTSGNLIFRVYFSDYNYEVCYDYESCRELEEQEHEQNQEKIMELLEKLVSNKKEFVGGFYIPWETTQFVNPFLFSCDSDIEEEGYIGSWMCGLEPVVCPPHGEQKEFCTRWNNNLNKEEKREANISCNPGICSGCYIPKWFENNYGENKCIPYGFRFENQIGWNFEETENEDEELISIKGVENDERINLTISPEGIVILYVEEWGSDSYTFEKGDEVEIDVSGWDDEITRLTMRVDDVVYDSENYEDSYIDVTFKVTALGRQIEKVNAYCEIDGEIKVQKTVDADGNWAECQNNYECESNVCSSGECIEVQKIINEASAFKRTLVRFWCRFTNPISDDEYSKCIFDLIGETPEGSSSSSGGGGVPAP